MIFFQIAAEEITAINVLQQATTWQDDLTLPVLPSLKTLTENKEEKR